MIDNPIPSHIHRDAGAVTVTWADGLVKRFPARWLRLACHCAHCREEMTGAPLLDPASVSEDVFARRVDLVGAYAIRVAWSDGHDTGMYTYKWLRGVEVD